MISSAYAKFKIDLNIKYGQYPYTLTVTDKNLNFSVVGKHATEIVIKECNRVLVDHSLTGLYENLYNDSYKKPSKSRFEITINGKKLYATRKSELGKEISELSDLIRTLEGASKRVCAKAKERP